MWRWWETRPCGIWEESILSRTVSAKALGWVVGQLERRTGRVMGDEVREMMGPIVWGFVDLHKLSTHLLMVERIISALIFNKRSMTCMQKSMLSCSVQHLYEASTWMMAPRPRNAAWLAPSSHVPGGSALWGDRYPGFWRHRLVCPVAPFISFKWRAAGGTQCCLSTCGFLCSVWLWDSSFLSFVVVIKKFSLVCGSHWYMGFFKKLSF